MKIEMRKKKVTLAVLCVLPLIGLLLLLRNLYLYASAAPVSFDGAMNLNTAVSFATGNGYGFFYDTFFPFPAQTDGPFILPAALLIRLFGVSPLMTHAVNLAYVAALLSLMAALLARLGMPLWAALAGALIAACTPGFSEYGLNGYGEIPALAWYLAAMLVFWSAFDERPSQTGALMAGTFLALSYLTKVVALVLVASFLMLAFASTVGRRLDRKTLLLLFAGLVLPIGLWEVFRAFSIGNAAGYVQWWALQLGQILHQSGARYDISGIAKKAVEHYSILCSITGLDGYLLSVLLASPAVLLLLTWKRYRTAERFVFVSMALSGAVYFSWWLLLTPTTMAWLRRILDAIVIHQLLVVALAFRIIYSLRSEEWSMPVQRAFASVIALVAIVPVVALALNGQNVTRRVEVPPYTESFFKLAALVKNLPGDATIFGTGWWQSPGIALYSGRKFNNFQHWTPNEINKLTNKYFAFDTYTTGLAKGDVVSALSLTETKDLFKGSGGELYRIDKALQYAPLDLKPPDLSRLKSGMDFTDGDYEFKRGFYQVESQRYAWMRPDGIVALARTAERRLVVSLVVPEVLNKDKPLKLRVVAAGCADELFDLGKPWENTVEIPLACAPAADRTPLYISLHVDRHMPFVHQIDADNRLLAVLVRSVALK